MNRMRQNTDSQWRTSQQLQGAKPLFKSPQQPIDDNYNPNPYPNSKPQNQNFINRNSHNLKGKPLISPKRTQNIDKNQLNHPLSHRPMQAQQNNSFIRPHLSERNENMRNCLNHASKKAEFMVLMNNEEQLYCGRCAAQLATRGCQVVQLQSQGGMGVSKKKELPHYPQYQDQPIYQQILEILRLCNGVVVDHNCNIERFAGLEQEYNQQIELTSAFYDRLMEVIEEMKADHLYDLSQERDKYTQIADIENDHLRENIIEINGIKNDIENHLQEVLEGIRESGNEAECRESLEHYRQKLTLFNHQIEEQVDSLKEITRYPQPKIDNMLEEFENFLKVLWDTPSQMAPQQEEEEVPMKSGRGNLCSALTVKNIHQILPRGVGKGQKEGRRAFRNLQEDEEQHLQERRSPNFKKI